MRDWNVVVSVHGEGFLRATRLLGEFGTVKRTGFYNILVMKVDDRDAFLERFAQLCVNAPEILEIVSRVSPAAETFDFDSPETFESQARAIALSWAPALAGKSFHVRFHRRGHKHELPSQDEERMLDGALMAALEAAGTPGRVTFDDPDAILDVETVGDRAGMALWSRDELRRYPFLKLD